WHATMDNVPQKTEGKENNWKVHKVRLFPNQQQRNVLKKWFGTARWTYNQCLAAWKTKSLKANKATFRSLFLNESSEAVQKNPWLKETPYDVRDEGMNDFLKTLKTCYAKGEQFN